MQTTGADDMLVIRRLVGQGPTAVSSGLHQLSPPTEHVIRATAAHLHEDNMRAVAPTRPAPNSSALPTPSNGPFLAKNPSAKDIPHTLAASPIEADRLAAPPARPDHRHQPRSPQANRHPRPRLHRRRRRHQAKAAPAKPAPAQQPTPVKARPATPKQSKTPPSTTPTSRGDVQQARGRPRQRREETPSQHRLTNSRAHRHRSGSDRGIRHRPSQHRPSRHRHTSNCRPRHQPRMQPPAPSMSHRQPRTQRQPTCTASRRGRRDEPTYHPWGPPKAVHAQPPKRPDPNMPAAAVALADPRLRYDQDRALRNRLQLPGASIPANQMSRPPHSLLEWRRTQPASHHRGSSCPRERLWSLNGDLSELWSKSARVQAFCL